jgi:hypothetical protein
MSDKLSFHCPMRLKGILLRITALPEQWLLMQYVEYPVTYVNYVPETTATNS